MAKDKVATSADRQGIYIYIYPFKGLYNRAVIPSLPTEKNQKGLRSAVFRIHIVWDEGRRMRSFGLEYLGLETLNPKP